MLLRKQATLDRTEGKLAVLSLENGQELRLLRSELGDAEVGGGFTVQILPEEEAGLERESLARTILNQIINDDSQAEN
ncbi:MAG: hypothetical protein WCO52_00575 [bacterium]